MTTDHRMPRMGFDYKTGGGASFHPVHPVKTPCFALIPQLGGNF
jgi:hypothetical protein